MADKRTVYRVQDKAGRGPWRPGFSRVWVDNAGPPLPPPIQEDFGPTIFKRLRKTKGHYGTACSSIEALNSWFTPLEQLRLRLYGYSPVCILADEVIAESEHQMIIRCDRALCDGAIVLPWSALEAKADA
jgi:hypothetical protein